VVIAWSTNLLHKIVKNALEIILSIAYNLLGCFLMASHIRVGNKQIPNILQSSYHAVLHLTHADGLEPCICKFCNGQR